MHLMRLLVALVSSACVSTAAHAAVAVPIGSGFQTPQLIALDSSGNVVVTDLSAAAVKRILVAGGYTTVETLGSGFFTRAGLDVDANDNVIVADMDSMGKARIKRILAAGGYTTVQTLWTDPATMPGTSVAPRELVLDSAGNIVFNNFLDHSVRRLLAAGGYVTLQTLGSGFADLGGIAIDASDNVYVTDTGNSTVRRLLAAGGYTTVETLGSGFTQPYGVAVGTNGDVYVSEGGGSVKKIEAAGGYTNVTTIMALAGGGDLVVDSVGDIYVTDGAVNQVKKILVSVDPTTASLTSNINPSVFRQNVTFTATVTGNNPTGTVNVFAGSDLLCGGTLPAGGTTVSCSSTALLAMSHVITARYLGDAVNYTSTSAPITQVVNKATTTTSVIAPVAVTLGQPVMVTATVAVMAPGAGTPTGVIAVSDGTVNCNIILPATSCSLTPTSVGPRAVTASYGGDPNYLTSSNTTTLTVVAPATSTTLASTINPSVYGQGVTFTATVAGNAPSGSVNFLDGATPVCSTVVLVAAQATCTTNTLTAGPHSITAAYSGDAGNGASTSAPLTQVVDQAATVTSVSSPGPITLGQSVVVTATITVSAPGHGAPTGTISVGDGEVNCTIVLPANACSLTPTTAGARTITGSYNGDPNFATSSGSASLTVNPSATGTAVASDINPSVRGQGVTFTATVTANAPTGTVDFLDGAMPLCTGVALAGIQASCASSALNVGAHSITATYSGDAGNNASTSTALVQVVDQAATVTSVSAPGPITLGEPVIVTATLAVMAPGAGIPTGEITISDGSVSCSMALPATTCSLTPNSAGSRTITASYAGDTNFAPSTGTTSLSVDAAAQTITVNAPSTVLFSDGAVTITATASSGLPVTLTSNTPGVCTVSGAGPFTVTLLSPGLCTLVAYQAGDVNNAPTSLVITLQVQGQIVQPIAVPALDIRSVLAIVLLLGMSGALRARRA
jgi:sugar lactone lactonase YvrE